MKRDFYLNVYTILKSDWINNMDHMLISGTGPSSVILTQIRKFQKFKSSKNSKINLFMLLHMEGGLKVQLPEN